MMIAKGRLEEFRRLYKEALGEEVSEDEAREITSRLVELYMMLAEPLPSERSEATMTLSPPENLPATDRTSSQGNQ